MVAQTSPAPASQAPAQESVTLTPEERTRAIEYLKQTQKDFLTSIEGLSEAQWKFKAAPDRWSIAETAEHIALAEQLIWDRINKMMKNPPAPEKRAEVQGKDEIVLTKVPDRSKKAQAPEVLRPTGKWTTKAALVKDFEATRANEISYVTDTKEDLRSHFEDHPFLKTMDAYQWILLNGAHCKRHTAQIQEVKADPNYPKS
jgi:uncharacterized damage-inducible protein DinB